MKSYRTLRIKSWESFLKLITTSGPYSNWAFRGQQFQEWPLYSALTRYLQTFGIDKRAWPEQEERILRVFKRKAHLYITQVPEQDDDFQWLALMQHHGAPTRLMDFTWSPYVAAFFALERATGEAAVWALNPARIQSRRQPTLLRRDPRVKGNFKKYYLKGDRRFIWVGEPMTMNRRQVAQSGTFVLAGVLDEPIEETLQRYPDPENTMVKLILPAKTIREAGMLDLYRMNITGATLFPDLDGLARSFCYELEFHWAYNPRTMEPYPT